MIEKATVEDLDQIIKLKIRMFEDMGLSGCWQKMPRI